MTLPELFLVVFILNPNASGQIEDYWLQELPSAEVCATESAYLYMQMGEHFRNKSNLAGVACINETTLKEISPLKKS